MARKPMITRTITSTKVQALCMDLYNRQAVEKELVLPRTYKDDTTLLKALSKEYDNDMFKVSAILSSEVENDLYGLTEQEFICYAKKLDKNRHIIDEETVNEETEQ